MFNALDLHSCSVLTRKAPVLPQQIMFEREQRPALRIHEPFLPAPGNEIAFRGADVQAVERADAVVVIERPDLLLHQKSLWLVDVEARSEWLRAEGW